MTTRSSPSSRDRGLHWQVINALGQDMVAGRLAPGAILNVEAMSERFAVSRTVLREALRVLQSLGMVQPRQRTGTQVLPRDSWDLMNPQVIVWRGRGPEYFTQMRELLELRLGLEPVAARLGAQAADAQQIASVRNAARTMVEAAEAHDGPGYLEADVAFHTSLLRGSGNQVIGHFATQVEAILRTRVEEARYTITTWTPAAARQHLDIAEALLGRDADTAGKLMADLIQATIDEFVMEAPRPS